jgi:hypothetical protein
MPAKNTQPQPEQTPQTVKFEISASKLFHLNVVAALSQVNLDVGAGDYGQKLTIPIPQLVQNVGLGAYSYVQPYAEWSYNKLLKKKATGASE